MKKSPNQELYRILRFAIRFPGWHFIDPDIRVHVLRAERLGLLEVNRKTKEFRLPLPGSLVLAPPPRVRKRLAEKVSSNAQLPLSLK